MGADKLCRHVFQDGGYKIPDSRLLIVRESKSLLNLLNERRIGTQEGSTKEENGSDGDGQAHLGGDKLSIVIHKSESQRQNKQKAEDNSTVFAHNRLTYITEARLLNQRINQAIGIQKSSNPLTLPRER